MAVIELQALEKKYTNGFHAVKGIDLRIEDGEFTVLVGASGCGKSTTLRMIAGLESISSGNLLFDQKRVNDIPPKDRDVGMVFQNYALYPHLTVAENIAFPLTLRKESKSIVQEKVRQTAQMLGLETVLERKPKELSGGQRQRVALGRAIIRTPKIFLFDEPLSNLDAQLRVTMRSEIARIQRSLGVTSVYVTHDQVEAMTMADKIVLMNAGTIVQIGTPKELYEQPKTVFAATFLGNPSMNIFHGKFVVAPTNDIYFLEEGSTTLDDALFVFRGNLAQKYRHLHGQQFTLGVRPEHVHVGEIVSGEGTGEVRSNSRTELRATVLRTEYLGHEQYIHVKTPGGLSGVFRTSLLYNIPENQWSFIVDDSKIILFDAAGERVSLQ